MGFSSKHRICNQVCFNDIFANGTTLNATGFKLFWNINEVMFPRIAIRVPKKEISGAVERNRVKRQLREVFRDQIYKFKTDNIHYHKKSLKRLMFFL